MRFYLPERQKILDFVIGRLKIDACCVLCGAVGRFDRDLCAACENLLIRTLHRNRAGVVSHLCLGCGRPHTIQRQYGQSSSDVGRNVALLYNLASVSNCCKSNQHQFIRIVAPYRYDFPLDMMIRQLKYGQQRNLARVMGSLLAAGVVADGSNGLPDCLIPMPLHNNRLKSRGFNQAADIARWCGSGLGVKSLPGAVSRVVDTGFMAGMSKVERQLQILGAFRASESLEGMRVAIVDDVLTTGATSRELARELYDRGVDSVELWVLARTSSERMRG